MRAVIAGLVVLGVVAVPLPARQDPFVELELRVAALRPGAQCIVDRGARDQVQVDDRVVLAPRGAAAVTGRVLQVEDRTSLVQLLDAQANVPVGTRGHVLLPPSRVRVAPPATDPAVPEPAPAPAPESADDDEWRPGMPLLGRRRPPQPHERESRLRGRLYASGNLVRAGGDFDQSFLNAGVDVDVNNVGGTGGTVRFHGAYNHSTEFSGNEGDDLRVFELSYEQGGTRFSPWRYQIGRFLPRDMPEFGLLDGVEVGYRREGGDRFGASLGYLPELDDDLESIADLQVAAWYLWNQDVGERLTFGLGYQRTWHRGAGDRQLVVAKARVLPDSGWDVSSAVWIDLYDGDDRKDEAFEVTRANVFASRRWQGEGGVELFYDHEEYPDLLRQDNPQTILPLTLLDAHVDRLSAHLWVHGGESTRWFTRLTGWVDEEHEGGAAELGVELAGLFGSGTRTVLALFEVDGPSSVVRGVRVEHGGDFSFGRLDLLYELGAVGYDDFPSAIDDLLQHRVGAVLGTSLGGGWDANFFTDVTVRDSELAGGVGVYLQRLF